jgi:hypothetical protein
MVDGKGGPSDFRFLFRARVFFAIAGFIRSSSPESGRAELRALTFAIKAQLNSSETLNN